MSLKGDIVAERFPGDRGDRVAWTKGEVTGEPGWDTGGDIASRVTLRTVSDVMEPSLGVPYLGELAGPMTAGVNELAVDIELARSVLVGLGERSTVDDERDVGLVTLGDSPGERALTDCCNLEALMAVVGRGL